MSLSNIIDRLYEINADIEGINRAFRRPPMRLDAAEIPAIMVILDRWDVSDMPAYARRTDHHLLLRVYGDSAGQDADIAARQQELEPFLERVLNAYDKAIKLNSLEDVLAGYQNITAVRFRVLPYAGVNHAALEFDLFVREETVVDKEV